MLEKMQDNIADKALVLDFSAVIYIDSSGGEALEELLEIYQEQGKPMLVCGLRQQPTDLLTRIGWLHKLGEDNYFIDRDALFEHLQNTV